MLPNQILFEMFSFLLVMKYMVAAGQQNITEIIDVSNPMKSCVLNDELSSQFSNLLPRYLYYSTGGMLGTTPVMCGGMTL